MRLWAALALCLCIAALTGCTEFSDHRAGLAQLYQAGHYDLAAAQLDDPKVKNMYGAKNQVLWEMDRGAVALALNDYPKTISLLEQAERTTEVQREKSLGDVLGQWTINDTAAKYIAEPYEDVYLNVLKLLAQLEDGRIQGGATVEARRLSEKADMLRDTFLKYEEAASKKDPRLGGRAPGSNVVATNKSGEFVESPLGTFLTAVTFMKSGDTEFQRVAGRRLEDSIQLQAGLIGPVNAQDFAGIGELDPSAVNVLIVALSGRGPTKYAQRVGPIPLGTIPVYFELPELRVNPTEVASARVEIEGSEGGGAAAGLTDRLKLVEDLSAVAVENHRRLMPAIYARTFARYAIKAGLSVAATEMLRRGAHDSDQGWVQLAGVVAGLVALGATERADLRTWTFLPGQARVGLMKLPAGPHRIRVVYESSFGSGYATPWKSVDVPEDGLVTIVTHYWR